jgi:hypothetical protein
MGPITVFSRRKLARGENIEEGNFMERMWSALLSEPISQSTQRFQLQSNNTYKVFQQVGPYKGMVLWSQQQLAEWQTFDQNIDFVVVQKQDLIANSWDTPSLSSTWSQQIMTWTGISNTLTTTSSSSSISKLTDSQKVWSTTSSSTSFLFRYPNGGDPCSGVIL